MKAIAIIALLWAQSVSANDVHVFFAGGQSNAKAEWAQAIERTLDESGLYGDVVVVHAYHPGAGIIRWLGDLYPVDFFNPEGTGRLQTAMQQIRDAGNNPVLSGLFWFQGERDARSLTTLSAYSIRWDWFLNRLARDLGTRPNYCLSVIDAADNMPKRHSRSGINAMRNVQRGIGAIDPLGVTFDTRGHYRPDGLHVTLEDLDSIGVGMATVFMLAFPPSLPD